ncbi:hypothetical protein A3850_007355 [Lewinella sp. 4G2]|nr:hypothetical protein A3850_007355 [Lewinella sp. 4G2]
MEASAAQGVTVALVANATWNFHNFRRGLINALAERGHQVLLLAPADDHAADLTDLNATFIPLHHLSRSGRNPGKDLQLVLELRHHYRKYGVSLAFLFTIKPVIYGTLAAVGTATRTIATLTGLGYAYTGKGRGGALVSTLYRLALKRGDFTYFHNPDDRQLFLEKGLVSEQRSDVIPGSGLDVTAYEPTPFPGGEDHQILFVGRLLEDKGIREFVTAAASSAPSHPNWTFHVVGDLDQENPAAISAEEVSGWKERPELTFHGQVADVKPYLSAASLVVLPSYREGCPRVLLEAGAMERPVIGADVPGVRSVIDHEKTGWLVPVGNASALSDAMKTALKQPQKLAEMGQAGRRRVAEGFSENIVVSEYLKQMDELTI